MGLVNFDDIAVGGVDHLYDHNYNDLIAFLKANILRWSVITVSQTAATMNGYVTNSGSLVTVTLPATVNQRNRVAVAGMGAGGWKVVANTGQHIHFSSATSATAGYLASTNQYDSVELLCLTANTEWLVIGAIGKIDVV